MVFVLNARVKVFLKYLKYKTKLNIQEYNRSSRPNPAHTQLNHTPETVQGVAKEKAVAFFVCANRDKTNEY